MLAHEAEQRGLDKPPRFEERLDFARLQILSQELIRQVQEEAAQVPAGDVKDYYRKNIGEFEVASFERIVIPNRSAIASTGCGAGQRGRGSDDQGGRASPHPRRCGEDFSKLQTQAYAAAGVSGDNVPNPTMDKIRRRSLPSPMPQFST